MWWNAFSDPLSHKHSFAHTQVPFPIDEKKKAFKVAKQDSTFKTSPASSLLAWIPSLPSMGLTMMIHMIKSATSSISFRDARRFLSQMQHLGRPFIKDVVMETIVITIEYQKVLDFMSLYSVHSVRAWDIPEEFTRNPCTEYKLELDLISPKNKQQDKILLYIHGGAYILGSSHCYRPFTSHLAHSLECQVIVPNYRLSPECPFPAALHDVFITYLFLTLPHHSLFQDAFFYRQPTPPSDIVVAGDSAGGGLCMALLGFLKDYAIHQQVPLYGMPSAAILLSPWLDLSASSDSYIRHESSDVIPSKVRHLHHPLFPDMPHPTYLYLLGYPQDTRFRSLKTLLMQHLDDSNYEDQVSEAKKEIVNTLIQHPLVSPLHMNLHDVPPILLQVGSGEMIWDDCMAFARKCPQTVKVEIYRGMFHLFQMATWFNKSQEAVLNINKFMRSLD